LEKLVVKLSRAVIEELRLLLTMAAAVNGPGRNVVLAVIDAMRLALKVDVKVVEGVGVAARAFVVLGRREATVDRFVLRFAVFVCWTVPGRGTNRIGGVGIDGIGRWNSGDGIGLRKKGDGVGRMNGCDDIGRANRAPDIIIIPPPGLPAATMPPNKMTTTTARRTNGWRFIGNLFVRRSQRIYPCP
jgi:hypothetical protein